MAKKKFIKNYHKKKLYLYITIGLFLFISVGYATLSTNLSILGNITIGRQQCEVNGKLYNVLKCAAEEGVYAKEYTESHQDSMDASKSTEKIYHWYESNNTNGTSILDKNNVIFAGQCWQMIRTTDTGGVKMIYNGEAVDNQCLSTRGTHVGYASRTSQTLNNNYWYGTDYTYDSVSKTFKLSGTTEQTTWSATTGPGLIGKYTCMESSVDGTCSTLHLVESYNNETSAYVIPLDSNSNYSQFGTLQFNVNYDSPSYVGYMYGDVYETKSTYVTTTQSFTTTQTLLSSSSFVETYKYSKTLDDTNSNYSLVNPILGSEITDDDYSGYYSYQSASTTSGTKPYYLVALNSGTNYYYVRLSTTKKLNDFNMMIGDSITDNEDGTYTINNTELVTPSKWYNNFADYKGKYTCDDGTFDSSSTCASPRYMTATTKTNYTYVNAGEKIMIGKTRSGLNLTDTLLVRKDLLVANRINYYNYKYTCNTDSATCTESTLRMITAFSATGYTYVKNDVKYVGSSVEWNGTNYTLVDSIDNFNNLNDISTHHYMCVENGLKICQTVAYVYYYERSGTMPKMLYITLKDGITTVSQALEDMMTKNTMNSTMKNAIDAWYKHYLLEDYDDYIEDTIYCNDRSIQALNGWNPNGEMTDGYLQFKEYNNGTSDLSCTNTTDQFSTLNNSAKLTYKVGLMSSSEANILNNSNARKTGQEYWLASPNFFSTYFAVGSSVYKTGIMDNFLVNDVRGVRPAVSLIPGIKYSSDGDGSMANPYVVITD